jgi:hypothetical protein
VPVKQIKLPSDSFRADLCLGLTVTGLYTLITMGLIIFFEVVIKYNFSTRCQRVRVLPNSRSR